MTRTAIACGALVALAIPLVGPAAEAHQAPERAVVSASDPDDVGSRLDILAERVRVGDRRVTLRIRTAETWGCRYLEDFGSTPQDTQSAALLWDVDTDRDGHFGDLVGDFSCDGGRFIFRLHDPSGEHGDWVYPARRPDRRTAVVRVPLRAVHTGRVHLRATSRVSGVASDGIFFEEDDIAPTLKLR